MSSDASPQVRPDLVLSLPSALHGALKRDDVTPWANHAVPVHGKVALDGAHYPSALHAAIAAHAPKVVQWLTEQGASWAPGEQDPVALALKVYRAMDVRQWAYNQAQYKPKEAQAWRNRADQVWHLACHHGKPLGYRLMPEGDTLVSWALKHDKGRVAELVAAGADVRQPGLDPEHHHAPLRTWMHQLGLKAYQALREGGASPADKLESIQIQKDCMMHEANLVHRMIIISLTHEWTFDQHQQWMLLLEDADLDATCLIQEGSTTTPMTPMGLIDWGKSQLTGHLWNEKYVRQLDKLGHHLSMQAAAHLSEHVADSTPAPRARPRF